MIRPERRTRDDLVAAAAIVAVVALILAVIWWRSSARATVLTPADGPAPVVTAAASVPAGLQQRWAVASARTQSPVVVGGTVVIGDGHTMAGLDPQNGRQRWSYARDRDLCGVSYVYDLAVAVYPDDRGCGQVSGIKADVGQRGPARTSYADKVVVLSSDGSAILSAGATRLELWRSDLVRVLSYGEIDAPVKPVNTRLGAGCALMSAASSENAVSVLEACRGEQDLRLALLKPGKEDDEPEIKRVALPAVPADAEARVLAVTTSTTAVYLPLPSPHVAVYDSTGTLVSTTPVPASPTLTGASPAVTRAGDTISWWTGREVMVFDTALSYRYTIDGDGPLAPVGPATMMAGRLLIPVATGLAVHNPADGTRERVIPLAHPAGGGPVMPAVVGQTVLEQREGTLVSYEPN